MFNDVYWHMSLDKFSAFSKKIVSVQFKIIVADQIIEMLLIFSHWKKNLYLFSTYIENCHQRNCRHSSSHARFVPLSINKTPQFTWIFISSFSSSVLCQKEENMFVVHIKRQILIMCLFAIWKKNHARFGDSFERFFFVK